MRKMLHDAQRARLTQQVALTVCLLLVTLWHSVALGTPLKRSLPPNVREIDIELTHKVIGETEIEAIAMGKTIFVNVRDLFSFIKVHIESSSNQNTLSGFYIHEDRKFTLNYSARTLLISGHRYQLSDSDLVERSGGIYLRADLFDKYFKLQCILDYNKLAINLQSTEALPAEREILDEQRREKARGIGSGAAPVPDQRLALTRSLFSLGTLDWGLQGGYSTTQKLGTYNFRLGGQFAGGDLDALIEGRSGASIAWANTPWRWRLPIQGTDLIRTILVGRRASFSSLRLADSMVGMQITNGFKGYRSSFTTYTITDRTEPDWIVELYVNETLVTYTKADQTGFFKFVIPLPYGSTDVKLRFIGPFGEERTKESSLRIPYTLLPPGDLEYTLTGGTSMVNPDWRSAVAKIDMNLGVSTAATVGGGLRYSRLATGELNFMPYATGSLRLSSALLVGGEYYHRNGIRTTLSVSDPNSISLNAEFDQSFTGGVTMIDDATIYDMRRLQLSSSLPWMRGMFRLTATDYPINSESGNFLLSGAVLFSMLRSTVSLSASTTYFRERFQFHSLIDYTGDLAVTLPTTFGIQCRGTATINYSQASLLSATIDLTRYIPNVGVLGLSGSHYYYSNTNSIRASFGYTLPFAQVGLTADKQDGAPAYLNANLQGSLLYDPTATNMYTANQPEVRLGGFDVVPFLDGNNNGKWDEGEPIIKRVVIENPAGRVVEQENGVLHVMGLEPYVPYYQRISIAHIENIALQPRFQSFEVTPPANGFARIEIPLVTVGQVEGYVTVANTAAGTPIGGVRIVIRHAEPNDSSRVVIKEDLLTYSNGEYFYLGLMPGKYRATPDSTQLGSLQFSSEPKYIEFTVKNREEGDLIEGIDFRLIKQDTSPVPSPLPEVPLTKPETPVPSK